jgi:histidinol-phosphate aminotransferase
MISVNQRLKKINEYTPSFRGINENIKKLDWNESIINLSEEFNRILITSISDIKLNEYPEIHNKTLLKKISDYCNISEKNVQVFNGSDSALHYIFATFLNETTNVLIFNPNYSQIETYVNLYSENITYSNILDIFKSHTYNFDDVINHDVIYLSNPNNPTGYSIKSQILLDLISKYPNKLFIIDEAYYEFDGDSICEFVNNYPNLIVTRTFSKAMSLASIRLGYICAHESIILQINKIRNTKEVNSFAQKFGEVVLDNIDLVLSRTNIIKKNRNEFLEKLDSIGISHVKSRANFVLIKTSNSTSFIKKCLDNNILVRDRSMFNGLENCVRITIGDSETMNKIIEILKSSND